MTKRIKQKRIGKNGKDTLHKKRIGNDGKNAQGMLSPKDLEKAITFTYGVDNIQHDIFFRRGQTCGCLYRAI